MSTNRGAVGGNRAEVLYNETRASVDMHLTEHYHNNTEDSGVVKRMGTLPKHARVPPVYAIHEGEWVVGGRFGWWMFMCVLGVGGGEGGGGARPLLKTKF